MGKGDFDPGRRETLRKLGMLAAGLALSPETLFSSDDSHKEREGVEHPFVLQWNAVLEKGIERLRANPKLSAAIGNEKVEQLVEVLKSFDLNGYIRFLLRTSKLNLDQVNGTIRAIVFRESDEMIAEADIEDGIMIVALGERLFRGGNIDAGTVHKVLRHEINHFLSGDVSPHYPLKLEQQDSVAERREEQDFTSRRMEKILQRLKDGRWKAVVPWVRLESGKLHTTFPFYEGATELAAVLPEILEHKVFKVAERGYNRGNTLTAFIIANMVGIRSFLRSYFLKDTSILEKSLTEKMDKEQVKKIFKSSLFEGGTSELEHLSQLHQLLTYQSVLPLDAHELIKQWWQYNSKETAAYYERKGVKMTIHMSDMADLDESPRFAVRVFAQCAGLHRSSPHYEDEYYREPFVISITEKKEQSLDLEQSSKIDDFISGYRRLLDTPLGTTVLHQPHLALGYDEQIRTYLETLNSLDHTSKDFSETLKKMYDYIADHVGTLNQRCVELIENSSQ